MPILISNERIINCFFCFNAAKNTRIALVTVLFFNDGKIKKTVGKHVSVKQFTKTFGVPFGSIPFEEVKRRKKPSSYFLDGF
jgi:hypothetical protein